MCIRKLKNHSGSQSVQVIQKIQGKYKVVKTIGSATTWQEIERLTGNTQKLFGFENDEIIEQAFALFNNTSIRTVAPDFVFTFLILSIKNSLVR